MSEQPTTLETREQLMARLAQLEAALADVEEEERFTLGQTGVHLGAARVDYLRRSWASERARVGDEMQQIRQAIARLEANGNG